MEDNGKKTSRREILKLGAIGLGVVGAMSIAGSADAQVATKAKQKAVMYQPTPKDGKDCQSCLHFQAPAGCRVVEGEISPNGYCNLFVKKA